MLFFDTKNLKAAGYDDPAQQISTWEEVHTALTKVVRTGKSGLMLGRDVIGDTVQSLAITLGWRGSLNGWAGMDMKTGRFIYDAPEVLEAFEFLQRLVKDKLVVSDYLTLVDKDARTRFASGNTGIMFVGPFSLPAWKKQAPDWKVSVAQLPSASGDDYVVPFAEVGANSPWVYAKTKLPRSVGQVLRYMGSREGQKELVSLSQGNLESIQQQANKEADRTRLWDENEQEVDLPGYRVDALADAAIRYIGDHRADPFFLFLSFLEPHHENHRDDYPAPAVYRDAYQNAWLPPDLAALTGNAPQHISGYYGMVRRLDEAYGRILDALRSLDLYDDAIVALVSDHGNHFRTRKSEYKRSVHDASTRVPLALHGPGLPRGRVVEDVVSTVNLPATLLDLAGITPGPGMQPVTQTGDLGR